MKTSLKQNPNSAAAGFVRAVLIAVLLFIGAVSIQAAQTRLVLPPASTPYGKTYAQWSAAMWQWALALPVEGHPFIDSPDFDVTAGQTGQVWFLAQPSDTVVRTCTIPVGKALFLTLPNSEWSSLEGYPTEEEQRAFANFFGDHIVDLFCTIDGVPVQNLGAFRVESAQFTFTAPSPWIFGALGGTGTAVSDGYFVMVAPLSAGQHTIRFGGAFHFAVAEGDPFDFDQPFDITYHLTVQ